ncbi:MAG: hypothetical protein V4496_05655 [Pseudomonadota bacterium]
MSKQFRAIFLSIALLTSFLFTSNIYADNENARLYKISVLIFKHLPADKNTSARLTNRWTEKNFEKSINIDSLPAIASALSGSNQTLSRDKTYTLIYNHAWIASLENETPTTFHFHKAFDNNDSILDGLINITLKYNLDVHFQTQLLAKNKIIALDETYQTPNNQLQYIDGPIYGALVLITHDNGQ